MSPIYIASKGRADKCLTAQMLQDDGVGFFLVVEPQDADKYSRAFPRVILIVLPQDNWGISFARNQILNHAHRGISDWVWMLDDDIKRFYHVKGDKCLPCPSHEALNRSEEVLKGVQNLAVGAMEYQQYAWSAKKNLAMNSYCDVAVFINLERTAALRYRDKCKEDRDLVLQTLSLGYDSARATRYAFSVPKNGSNKGGLHDAYANGLETEWSKNMVKMWPGVCEHVTKKDGRRDVKIHWKKLKGSKVE